MPLAPQRDVNLRAEPGHADAASRIIAWVHRGVVMKRTSSDTAGWRTDGANVAAHHSPDLSRPGPVTRVNRPAAEVLRDGETDRQRDAADALHFLEGGGVALEDSLPLLRNRQSRSIAAISPSVLPATGPASIAAPAAAPDAVRRPPARCRGRRPK